MQFYSFSRNTAKQLIHLRVTLKTSQSQSSDVTRQPPGISLSLIKRLLLHSISRYISQEIINAGSASLTALLYHRKVRSEVILKLDFEKMTDYDEE
jgi:hypothetical protein